TVPILPCTSSPTHLIFQPSPPPSHPLQSPTLDISSIPPSTLTNLKIASEHLHKERLVAIPTETVYGLAASTASEKACRRVYKLKGRPSDNPLIVHISSLDMLSTLTPPGYTPNHLQMALISAFWPGPLTLLFPARNPPAPPAPQTIAVRFPAHPTARALITLSGLAVSAPSANRSGRPSPTSAEGVWRDLGGLDGDEQGVLGCILDAGPCSVGLESTVVDATSGFGGSVKGGFGGVVKVLRPGGVGVEAIEEIEVETETGVDGTAAKMQTQAIPQTQVHHLPEATTKHNQMSTRQGAGEISNPSTPGMKYKHYSPSVPVYLVYPSDVFTTSSTTTTTTTATPKGNKEGDATNAEGNVRLGVMVFEDSPLRRKVQQAQSQAGTGWGIEIEYLSLGKTVEDAARRLFGGMLALEGKRPDSQGETQGDGVDAIVIEATNTYGIGLAFMERAGKAVGGGGGGKGLGQSVDASGEVKRFLVDVE
ncbi:DHBP synthase RibB-like alpha/beta domain-containing protein, partial [Filobasidium floriforme]|uniref:DHBP synthase RibB-like alpha/beta domain-containing protein n=1 Tax=Filobasidium floriforme TaxID=5210 RepID=UPI001E8D506A